MKAETKKEQEQKADPEAVALFVCYEALRELPPDGARRVVEYLKTRFMDHPLYRAITYLTQVESSAQVRSA